VVKGPSAIKVGSFLTLLFWAGIAVFGCCFRQGHAGQVLGRGGEYMLNVDFRRRVLDSRSDAVRYCN
jgi:hypothetical protein